MKNHRFWFRSSALVAAVVSVLDEEGDVRLPDLVAAAAGFAGVAEPTARGCVAELAAAGFVHVTIPDRRGEDRSARLTVLGRAVLYGLDVPALGGKRAEWVALEEQILELMPEGDGVGS